jgi:hypothetical protein
MPPQVAAALIQVAVNVASGVISWLIIRNFKRHFPKGESNGCIKTG